MKMQGALIREQGVRFAVVVVKSHVLANRRQSKGLIEDLSPTFGGVPVVLMAEGAFGRARYFGRPDLVRFLSRISPASIPWREFDIR
jgi:hypothetical protein